MPKRQLKGQGAFVNVPGVGFPAQMRFSVTKRFQFLNNNAGNRVTVIWNLCSPADGPTVNGTLVTTVPIPDDFTELVNMFTYRRWAVYAVNIMESVAAVTFPADANANTPFESTIGVTSVPSGTQMAIPVNFDSLSDVDFDRYMTFNNRSRTYKISHSKGDYPKVVITSAFNIAEILGIPKEQVYEPQVAGICTAAGTYVQPANSAVAANSYRAYRVTGIYPTQYGGSTTAVNTPGEVTSPQSIYECQITYHMILFNDIANDQAIGTPALADSDGGGR